jgi:hypothetical protein
MFDIGRQRGRECALGALHGGADQVHPVVGHADDEGRGGVLEVAAAVHGLLPARVGKQVKGDEFEPRGVGAGPGKGVAHLVGLGQIAHTAADGVASLQQLQGDMTAQEAGYAGEQDAVCGRIGHGWSPE